MSSKVSNTSHKNAGHSFRRFSASVAVLLSLFFVTTLTASNSAAWTNNSKTYNLIQDPSWGTTIATDGLGNSYVAIQVKNTFTIGSVTANVGNSWRYLVVKTDRDGEAVWGTVVPDGVGDVNAIDADSAGNVYLAGQFSNTTTIGGTSVTSAGASDIWVAKMNTAGSVLWVRTFGGADSDWGNGVGVDGSGNVYVSGGMQGSVAFGGTTLTSAGNNDLFLVKLNSSGTTQWATRVGGVGDDNGGWMQGLAVDSAGNAFVSGQLDGNVSVAGSLLTSAGGRDAFVGKVNSSGVWQWGAIGGSSNTENAYGVAVDGQGGAYLTGIYRGDATFGSATLNRLGNGDDVFLAKVNSSGTWQWARPVQGTGDEAAVSIDVDASGGPVIAGYFFSSTMTVGTETLTYAGGTHADAFAAKWNSAGTFQWAVHLGGTYDDGFYGVAVDSDDNARLTGWAGKSNTVSFDGAAPISIMSSCSNECWSYVEWKVAAASGVTPTTTTTTTTIVSATTAPTSTTAPQIATTNAPATVAATTAPVAVNQTGVGATPSASVTTAPVRASKPSAENVGGAKEKQSQMQTSVPSTSTTTTLSPVIAPEEGSVDLGSATASVEGEKVAITIRRESNNIVANAAGITARYGAIDQTGKSIPLDSDGNLRVMPGQTVSFSIEGAGVGSKGEAWMFSNPIKIGTFEVADSGSSLASFKVPEGVNTGEHTLVVSTRDGANRKAELRLGFAVGEMSKGVSVSAIAVALLVIAGMAAVMLPVALNRRRRTA
jgi:hypothetical protein